MPQQRKKEESEMLRGERDQIKCEIVITGKSPAKKISISTNAFKIS